MSQSNVNDAAIDNQQLDQIAVTIAQLLRKERSLRECITYLSPSILEALAKGYFYSDMTTLIQAQGVEISVSTLKQYLYCFKKDNIRNESTSSPEPPVANPVTPPATAAKRRVDMPAEL